MEKSFIAIGVASLLGLTSVVASADVTPYGSIRAGVTTTDDGATKKTDIGKNTSSRIGIKASSDLGNGQSVGGQIEFSIAEPGETSLNTRRRNVWLGGGWGKLTLGKQGGIYRSAANWDQSNYLGGNVRYGGDVDAVEGIAYESNLASPFSFSAEVAGEDGIQQWAATAHYNFGIATLNVGYHDDKRDSVVKTDAIKGVVKAKQGFVVLSEMVKAAEGDNVITVADKVAAKDYYDNAVVSVNGSAGGFDWYLAYERSTRTDGKKGKGLPDRKASTFGAFAGYNLTENDKIYAEYEKGKIRDRHADDVFTADSQDAIVVGYSHTFGGGLNVGGEYGTVKNGGHKKDAKANTLAVVFKYGF